LKQPIIENRKKNRNYYVKWKEEGTLGIGVGLQGHCQWDWSDRIKRKHVGERVRNCDWYDWDCEEIWVW
jgi:hypothetical protein